MHNLDEHYGDLQNIIIGSSGIATDADREIEWGQKLAARIHDIWDNLHTMAECLAEVDWWDRCGELT